MVGYTIRLAHSYPTFKLGYHGVPRRKRLPGSHAQVPIYQLVVSGCYWFQPIPWLSSIWRLFPNMDQVVSTSWKTKEPQDSSNSNTIFNIIKHHSLHIIYDISIYINIYYVCIPFAYRQACIRRVCRVSGFADFMGCQQLRHHQRIVHHSQLSSGDTMPGIMICQCGKMGGTHMNM